MWSPNGKVWSPEMKNVESKNLQSRRVMMMIGVSLTFRSKGNAYTNVPPPTFGPNVCIVCSSSHFLKNFLARSIACNRRN